MMKSASKYSTRRNIIEDVDKRNSFKNDQTLTSTKDKIEYCTNW